MSKPSSSSHVGDARSSSSSPSPSLLSKNPSSHGSNGNMATTASAIFPHGYENRNAEEVHIRALAAARIKHDQVRQQALAVLETNHLQEETARLQAIRFEQEKRIKANQVRDEEQQKIRQLKEREERQARLAKAEEELRNKEAEERIDALLQSAENKARNTTTPPVQSSTSESAPRNGTISFTRQQQASAPIPSSSKNGVIGFSSPPSSTPPAPASNTALTFTPQLPTQPFQSNQRPSIKGKEPATRQQTPNAAPAASSAHATTTLTNGHPPVHHVLPHVERYAEIHKSLKEVRNYFKPGGNAPVELRKIANDRRREITKFMGQLVAVGDKSGNLIAGNKIKNILDESLEQIQSLLVDPGMYTVITPDPDPQAKYNDKLPIMFIYLLNSLSKAAISQFAQEASSNPKAADPIGILVVRIFSLPGFHWRGKTLIDIIIAKFRVVLPVVFGIRGNDNTEEGRARVGWRRVDGQWATEQDHQDRMVGLAAGYASISLRDFSNTKARLTNPYPPTHYWQAMATISSTPAQEQSVTQYIVLRAMTEFYEARFLTFYGDFAKAALKAALVEFPNRSTLSSTAAVSSLKVLADKLKRDMGLDLLLK